MDEAACREETLPLPLGKGRAAGGAEGTSTRRGEGPGPAEEFSVLISRDGTAVFSWNTPGIQELAKCLGVPEFDPPGWCG